MEDVVLASKSWGVDKLVETLMEKFKEGHSISKRQIKFTLEKHFVKEVRAVSPSPSWYKRTAEDMAARAKAEAEGLPMPVSESGMKSMAKKKAKVSAASGSDVDGEKAASEPLVAKKKKPKSEATPADSEGKSGDGAKKRKIEPATAKGAKEKVVQEEGAPPKKPRAAFTIFCVDERAEAKRALKERNNGHCEPDALANECKKRWSELSSEQQSHFEGKAKLEKHRYQRELKVRLHAVLFLSLFSLSACRALSSVAAFTCSPPPVRVPASLFLLLLLEIFPFLFFAVFQRKAAGNEA